MTRNAPSPAGPRVLPGASRARRESRVVAFVRKRPLVTLLLVFNTLGQAVALVPVVAYLRDGTRLDADLVLVVPTLLFLLLPALVITRVAYGPAALRTFLRAVVRFRVRPRWYVLVLVALPAATVALQWSSPTAGWSASTVLGAYGAGFLVALAFNFLTTNWWEESVWTGFFQASLQERFGPVRAVLLTWPFFLLEHVTLVLPGSVLGGGWSSLLALAVVIPFFRCAMVYVYNRTGSLALVGLLRASSNAVGFGLMTRLYGTGGQGLLVLAVLGLVALVATRGRLGLARA